MKEYQLTYLVSPETEEKELGLLEEKIVSLIQKEEGFLSEVKTPIKRSLAYPIKKKTNAYFVSIDFQLKPEGLKTLEKELKKEEKIIRYLIVSKKKEKRVLPPFAERKKIIPKVELKTELKEIDKKLEEILNQ